MTDLKYGFNLMDNRKHCRDGVYSATSQNIYRENALPREAITGKSHNNSTP